MLSNAPANKPVERFALEAATVFSAQPVPQKYQLVAQWVVEDGQLVCKWMTR